MKATPSLASLTKLNLLLAGFCLICPIHSMAQAGLDASYGVSLTSAPKAMAIQADGKLVIADSYQGPVRGLPNTGMYRFTVDGGNDSSFAFTGVSKFSFDSNFNRFYETGVSSISCFLDGTVALSGYFNAISRAGAVGVEVPKIFKTNESGSLVGYAAPKAYTFFTSTTSKDSLSSYICSLPDNGAIIYGQFNAIGSNILRSGIARLSPTGAFIDTFLPSPGYALNTDGSRNQLYRDVRCIVPQPDGKFLIGGEFIDFNDDTTKRYLVRVNSRGALDSTFNPNPDAQCYVISPQADGKILVAGNFNVIGGGSRSYLARLNADGTLDATFNAVLNSSVNSIQTRVDGKIFIAGIFTSVNGIARGRYALLNDDGSLNSSYASLGANDAVYSSVIQNDGKIILAGDFNFIGTTTKNYLARLNPDEAAINSVTTDVNGSMIEWARSGAAPEIENAEFRMRLPPATAFTTVLGKGVRTATGWKLDKLKLPGNKTFDIQVKGLTRAGFYNSSTSVIGSILLGQFRPLPVITSPALTPQKVVVGASGINFSITATSAATITLYQWKRNGVAILGATNPSYTIPGGVTPAQAGTYTCTVTSTAGSVTTNPGALLTVVTPITITKQPIFQAVLPGKAASFSVTATGTLVSEPGIPLYQWFKGSLASPVAIGTSVPTFKIPVVSSTDESDYWVEITNFAGMVRSDLVKLYEVTAGATVMTAPANAIFAMNGPATLTAAVLSESPPVNQWLKNKTPVKGGTSIPLMIPSIKLTDAGKYTIKTTNPAGSQTSTPDAEVAVVDRISTRHFVVAQNGAVSMTAIAAGNGLTYKWKKVGGPDMVDTLPGVTPSVAGSSTKTLTIKGLQTTDRGEYTCEVTAPGGMLESAVQKVTVTTGPPVITSPLVLPVAMVGDFYDYTVPVNGPAEITPNKFEAKGLPAGLTIDAFSGRITGRPSLAKSVDVTYLVTITASNGSGKALLSATANLVVRPITGGTALVGSFIGVIAPSALDTAFQDGGRIDLTTTTAGAFSGKVTLGTTSISFKGGKLNVGVTAGVDYNNRNSITIPRRGLPSLTVEFDLNIGTLLLLNGQITDSTVTSSFSGWKNKWSTAEKALLYKGYYTMALEAPAAAPGDLSYPLGDGYAAFTVTDLGTLTVVGKLADGTTFTTSSGFVGPTGQIAVYNSLYAATGGSFWSDGATITSAGAAPGYLESTVGGLLKWTKRPQTTGYTYRDGFGPLSLNIIGTRYDKTTAVNTNILGVSVLTNDAQLTYSGANVETETENPSIAVRLTDRNVFSVPTFASGVNPATTAISVVTSTGILTTSFVLTEDVDPGPDVYIVRKTAKGAGIVVRNSVTGTGVGYGHFVLPQSPGSTTSQLLSGRLRVTDATP